MPGRTGRPRRHPVKQSCGPNRFLSSSGWPRSWDPRLREGVILHQGIIYSPARAVLASPPLGDEHHSEPRSAFPMPLRMVNSSS